jgi:hypothetical protein
MLFNGIGIYDIMFNGSKVTEALFNGFNAYSSGFKVVKDGLKLWLSGKDFTNYPTATDPWVSKALFDYEYTNEISNSDFSNGITGWESVNAGTPIAENNVCKFTATAYNGRVYQSEAFTEGKKYYVRLDVKADSNQVKLDAGHAGFSQYHSGSGEFETLSTLVTAPSTADYAVRVLENRSSGFTEIQIRNGFIVSLTDLFGAGNEPDKAWCDQNLSFTTTTGTCKKGYYATANNFAYTETSGSFHVPIASGKNIYNGEYIDDKYVNSLGNLADVGSGWGSTKYLPVEPSTEYTQNYPVTDGTSARVAFYDSSLTFISSVFSQTFTTPANAKYMRTCWKYSINDYNLQIELGDSVTTYEPWTGKTEKMVVFDGVDDYCYVSSADFLSLIGNEYSICFKATIDRDNTSLSTAFNRVVSFNDGSTNVQAGIAYDTTKAKRIFYIQESTGTTIAKNSDADLEVGEEYTVTVTRSTGGEYNVYIDGVLSNDPVTSSKISSTNQTNSDLLFIGQRGDDTSHILGDLYDVMIYDKELTQDEIFQNYLALKNKKGMVTDNLQLYLRGQDFTNDPATTTWEDKSGNDNDATPSNFAYTRDSGRYTKYIPNGKNLISYQHIADKDFWETPSVNVPETAIINGSEIILTKSEPKGNQIVYKLNDLRQLLKPNTQYTLSLKNFKYYADEDTWYWLDDIQEGWITLNGCTVDSSSIVDGDYTRVFTTPADVSEVYFRVWGRDATWGNMLKIEFEDFMIELGDTATDHENWTGTIEKMVAFDGVDDYADLGNPTGLQITGELTLDFIIEGSGATSTNPILGKYKTTEDERGYAVTTSADDKIKFNYFRDGSYVADDVLTSTTATLDGTRYHVTCVFKPSEYARIYIDGVLDAEDTTNIQSAIHNSTDNFYIGTWNEAVGFYEMNLHHVAVYDKALTQDEIIQNYIALK